MQQALRTNMQKTKGEQQTLQKNKIVMSAPSGSAVVVIGVRSPSYGCFCEDHAWCGLLVQYDSIL